MSDATPHGMMFQVRTRSPFDDHWFSRDLAIEAEAGRPPDFTGSDGTDRDLGWYVPTMEEAQEMRAKLMGIPDVVCTVREQ